MTTRSQFDEALLAKDADVRLGQLQESGTLLEVFPEVQAMVGFGGSDTGHKDLWGHTKQVVAQCVPDLIVRWAALFHDVGKVISFSTESGKITFHGHEFVSAKLFQQAMKRTNFFENELETCRTIQFVIRHIGLVEAYETAWTDSAVRRLARETQPHFDLLLALARADITTKHADKRQRHLTRMKQLSERVTDLAHQDAIVPALPKGLGDVLIREFGLEPSKELGALLQTLREKVEAGDLPRQADMAVYVAFVREYRGQLP